MKASLLVAIMIVTLVSGCGSEGNDCKRIAYDPTGTWTGTLPYDLEHSNIGPAAPVDASHSLEFDDCDLVLIDQQLGIRYRLDPSSEGPRLHFTSSKRGPLLPDLSNLFVTEREITYENAEDGTADVLYRIKSLPPHDVLFNAWSGTMNKQEY